MERGRVEAEPLDGDLELAGADRPRGVEAGGRLGQRTGWLEDPVGPEAVAGVGRDFGLLNDRSEPIPRI
jgi:hypothetical protein